MTCGRPLLTPLIPPPRNLIRSLQLVEDLKVKYPGAMEYFYAQDADYAKLKDIAAAVSRGEREVSVSESRSNEPVEPY